MVKELKRKFIMTTMLVVTLLLVVFLASVNLINYVVARNESRSRLNQIVEQNLRAIPGSGAGSMRGPEEIPDDRGRGFGAYFIVRVDAAGTVTFSDLTHASDLEFDQMIALINKVDVEFAPEATGETEAEPAQASLGEALPPEGEGRPGSIPPSEGEGSLGNAPPSGLGEKPGKEPAGETLSDGEAAIRLQEESGSVDGYFYYASQDPDGSVSYAFLDISQETASLIRIGLITAMLGVALWLLILVLVVFLSKKAIAPIAENMEKQRLFITNAGHEFKTPLSVIVSNVDVQELHGGKTKWLDNIRAQALRLSELTKQMLTLAKMDESGTFAFTSTTFDASQILEDTIGVFRESASLRGIRIQTRIEPSVQMHFPKDQYQQLLELMLDNAVKYGKENGFLSVALSTERKMVQLTFRNDCDMLPETDPDQLFDRFYRPDSSRSRNTGGSGIGLAVVRAIAQQGGGSAQAKYLPDQVIEFVIELPKKL